MESSNNDPIGKSLNLTPIQRSETVVEIINNSLNDSARTDFDKSRSTMHTAMEMGIDALSQLSEIAEQSQNPRAFEVMAKLIESITATSKELLNLQNSIREIDAVDKPINGGNQTINNNLFVGSTAELQKVLKQLNDKQ